MAKRNNQFIVNLTVEEAQLLKTISAKAKRKPSEMLYLVASETLANIDIKQVNTGVKIPQLHH